jgi:membrane protease YdiL (CAAX protease family)
MNVFQAIVILIGLTIIRAIVKHLFLEYYYTALGDAIATTLSLGCTILISRKYLSKYKIQFFPTNSINSNAIGIFCSTTFFLFLVSFVIGESESLLRIGSDRYFGSDFIFGWSSNMKRYFLGALIVAPVLEELFTSGILLQGLLKNYSRGISILVTTLIFTSMHFSRHDFVEWDFLVSDKVFIALNCVFVSWVMIKTSNILITILLHFLWNLLNYAIPLLVSVMGLSLTNSISFYVFSLVVLLASTAMLIRNVFLLRSGEVFDFEMTQDD